MNINLSLHGQWILLLIIVWVTLITYCSNKLARKKTKHVNILTIVGLVLSLIPPLGIVYVLVLLLLKDRNATVGIK